MFESEPCLLLEGSEAPSGPRRGTSTPSLVAVQNFQFHVEFHKVGEFIFLLPVTHISVFLVNVVFHSKGN